MQACLPDLETECWLKLQAFSHVDINARSYSYINIHHWLGIHSCSWVNWSNAEWMKLYIIRQDSTGYGRGCSRLRIWRSCHWATSFQGMRTYYIHQLRPSAGLSHVIHSSTVRVDWARITCGQRDDRKCGHLVLETTDFTNLVYHVTIWAWHRDDWDRFFFFVFAVHRVRWWHQCRVSPVTCVNTARLDLYRWKIINLRANATSKRLQFRIVNNIREVPPKNLFAICVTLNIQLCRNVQLYIMNHHVV